MERISGFSLAKVALSRQVPDDFHQVSPFLKQKLKEMFGCDDPEQAVRHIIAEVRSRGDDALLDFTSKIDGVELDCLEVDRQRIASAYQEVDSGLVAALELAAGRIRSFHTSQRDSIGKGFTVGGLRQLIRPLERVGLYAPGGTAAYPSTVLMTAIPAKVAGVKETILASAPKSGGVIPPATLVAADIAGVDRVFAIGGAQAVAALAFGTASIPKVDKICGPGNIFVVLAKKLVYGAVDIDGLQGPSEVIIIADDTADAGYCAADILAQAEHDPLASAILITTSSRLADEVEAEVERQLAGLSRRAIVAESLRTGGRIVVVAGIDEAIELANLYAPEHLCLVGNGAAGWVDKISNAGCVFVGGRSTVVLGDYVAGPSHVLPTGGTARFSSPLNVSDFVKFINVVGLDDSDVKRIGPAAVVIARAEGLEAHARAMEKRLGK
ncbi:MAG: histidinol dehydrogenase [Dehalococcoidales bacterium]|nr:histidinol dehydrogenase [Dehalococcoidales bacterium]